MSLFQRYLGRKFASYNNMLQWVIAGRLGLWFKDTALIRRQNFFKIDETSQCRIHFCECLHLEDKIHRIQSIKRTTSITTLFDKFW